MSNEPTSRFTSDAHREKHGVALASLLAAVVLTGLKIVVGLATGSLGILAEAAHSALDLVAAAITLWAVWISARPADRRHTYGHGKFENFSALVETLLLLATCAWIVYESVRRLFFMDRVEVDANVWAFIVVVVSIVIDFSRSRALQRAAEKHRSQALEADALHFSTDIWSSAVVLLGLSGVVLGERLQRPWLVHADAVAALGVALIVIAVSFRLGKKSIEDLLDSVPDDLRDAVHSAAARVSGVQDVTQVRVRRSGPEIFADVTLTIDRTASFEKTHDIADQTEEAIRTVVPSADVVVHVEPKAGAQEDLLARVRLLAARHGLGAHAVRLSEQRDRRMLELHLEVDESLTLEQAHQQATQFEEELHRAMPELSSIVSHLEPTGQATETVQTQYAGQTEVQQAIRDFLQSANLQMTPHEVQVRWAGDKMAVSLHCTLDPGTAITTAHDLTERLEQHIRTRVPRVGRVVIHVEPARS